MISKEESDSVFSILMLIAFIGCVPYLCARLAFMPIDPVIFIFFEIPLYAFLMWAVYMMFKMKRNFDKLYKKDNYGSEKDEQV